MATTASIEASEIRRRGRRRLIGALVLVVLGVVFIPMFLDSEPRQKRAEPSLEIPPKDKVAHVRQQGIGHLPYVEAKAQEVQQAINKFVDAASADFYAMQMQL